MHSDIHIDGIPIFCVSCEARHRGVCGALESDQLASLARTSRRWIAERGTELMGASKPIESYANVVSGVVKLEKTLSDGRQQIVALQFATDFLGRPFSDENSLYAEAATKVLLCVFPRQALERTMQDSPALKRRIVRPLSNWTKRAIGSWPLGARLQARRLPASS